MTQIDRVLQICYELQDLIIKESPGISRSGRLSLIVYLINQFNMIKKEEEKS